MTDGQYRALVAYLNYWPSNPWPQFNLYKAMLDIGITDSIEDVIDLLAKAGHVWDEEHKKLVYVFEDDEKEQT